MASPAHEDSLVFADDTSKSSNQYGDPELPTNSNFSPVSQQSYELTQLDQSTSPVFRDRSFSSSEQESGPFAVSRRRESLFEPADSDNIGSDGAQIHLHMESGHWGSDTQQIAVKNSQNDEEDTVHDTQVVGFAGKAPRLEIGGVFSEHTSISPDSSEANNTRIKWGDPLENDTSALEIAVQNADTQLIGALSPDPAGPILKHVSADETAQTTANDNTLGITREFSDTQVIQGPDSGRSSSTGHKLSKDIMEEISNDTQVIKSTKAGDTQVIGNIIKGDDMVIKSIATQDTQVNITGDTQVIQRTEVDHGSGLENQHTQIFRTEAHDTQVIGANISPIQNTTTTQRAHNDSLARVESSPSKNFEFETTLFLSPQRMDEPTTQVLNTQEELIDEKPDSVDLGHKPVFSSGQNDGKLRSDLSIISNEDDFRNKTENELLCEDSVFQYKKRRRLAGFVESDNESVEGEESTSSTGKGYANGLGCENPQPVISSGQSETQANTQPSQTHSESKTEESLLSSDKLAENQTLEQGENGSLSNGKPRSATASRSVSSSPKPAIADLVPRKYAWSQSSSELEDVSHDVHSLDLDALPGGPDDFEDSTDRITVPAKRRRTEIPPTQSQKAELRDGDVENLFLDAIAEPSAVWAFSQFKLYPARVLRSGDGVSYIEFADLAQEAKNSDLYLLDVRLGDVVHVIQAPGEYEVTGMVAVNAESPFKCIRGYDTLYLAKKGRKRKEIAVPLSRVYMEVGEWALHQQKFHIWHDDIDLVQENFAVVKNLLPRVLDETQPQITPAKSQALQSNLLQGMVFFVTSIEGDRKARLADMILHNGGVFIDDQIKHYATRSTRDDGSLYLSLAKLGDFRFGALLADGYSRSAKYIQALALGWPVLADCFVEQALKDPAMLDHWPVFLLPAGHSLYTNVVRSMDVYEFRNKCERKIALSGQFTNNSHLLAAHQIVILNRNQDARTLDMCRFVFHAFGASLLHECLTVGEINKFLRAGHLSNALVYDNASREYFQSRKRAKLRLAVGVIDWEWVVQCAISGYIWPRVQ